MIVDLIILIWIHFIADFLLQSDKIALNKSSSNIALTKHVALYSICFLPFGYKFVIITWMAHWLTDYISSRVCKNLYGKGERHWFFVVIGLDQALHLTALFLTYKYIHYAEVML